MTTHQSVKLAKFLAQAGVAARRQAEGLILAGKIMVNGQKETNVARRVDPARDKVQYRGRQLSLVAEKIILLLNKPVGVVSTVHDPDGKPTVMSLIPAPYRSQRLFPVGRLDEQSEGLIILTNDGDLAYSLTHPKFATPKTYQVWIAGQLTPAELHRLRTGVRLKDGLTQPAAVMVRDEFAGTQLIEITITEGRHHQVRRMMRAVNHPVQRLQRVSMGPYHLGNLAVGEVKAVALLPIAVTVSNDAVSVE